MTNHRIPKIFISYSHQDKLVAHRIHRRFEAHGVSSWLDAHQLRLGAKISPAVRKHIEASDVVLVIASTASATSKWVQLELQCATEYEKPVIPLFIENVSTHESFREYLGEDASSPQEFALTIQNLMINLLLNFDQTLPQPDPSLLEAGLRQLALQQPNIAPLVAGCLDGEGLHLESLQTIVCAPFHAVDEAVESIAELQPGERIAAHLATCFREVGAGTRGLLLWIASTGDGGLPLVSAVGRNLKQDYLPAALKLLDACSPPNNHALYQFISHNAEKLDESQRNFVLRLATWPVRTDISNLADVLAWVAYKKFPINPDIMHMWIRWIDNGAFDERPYLLATYLADAENESLPGWELISMAVRRHVRYGLRSGDRQKVVTACDYIREVAEKKATRALQNLLDEAYGVTVTYEWKEWEAHDLKAAEWAGRYVRCIVYEAQGDHRWWRAMDAARNEID